MYVLQKLFTIIRKANLSDLRESIVAEITVDKKKMFLNLPVYIIRQSNDKVETSFSNLNFLFNNINVKHSKWCFTYKSNKAGIVLENFTSGGGNQIINKPTHFTNVTSSYIDLIFVPDTTYLTTGIEQSIYHKCRYNIINGKLNFNIPCHHIIIRK